jgi:hypothetical protein
MKALIFILGLIAGIILISIGGYHLLTQHPFLLHSYTVHSILYVVAGLLMAVSAVIGLYDELESDITERGAWLLALSVIVLIGGYGYYRYYTSRVVVQKPFPSKENVFLIFVSSDRWTSPELSIKPNQTLNTFSTQPFHVVLGDVEAEAKPASQGLYRFAIATTGVDFNKTDDEWGITKVTAKDTLQVRLSQAASETSATVGIRVVDTNHDGFVEYQKSKYYWSLAGTIIGVGVLIGAVLTGAYFGLSAWVERDKRILNKRNYKLK